MIHSSEFRVHSAQCTVQTSLLLLLLQTSLNVFHSCATGQTLLDADQLRNTINHLLHQLHLGKANALLVRYVPLAADSSRVLTRRAARLQVKGFTNLLEQLNILVQLLELDHHGCAQASAQVRWTRPNETQILAVHQISPRSYRRSLHRIRQRTKASKHILHVALLSHGDDTAVILFVAP